MREFELWQPQWTLFRTKAQRAAFGVALDMALKHIEKDTSKGLLDVLDISQKFMGDTFKKETFEAIRAYISNPENKWMQFVDRHLHRLHPNVIKTTALNLGFEAAFRGTKTIRKMRPGTPLQHPLADPDGSHRRLQHALHRLLGR